MGAFLDDYAVVGAIVVVATVWALLLTLPWTLAARRRTTSPVPLQTTQ